MTKKAGIPVIAAGLLLLLGAGLLLWHNRAEDAYAARRSALLLADIREVTASTPTPADNLPAVSPSPVPSPSPEPEMPVVTVDGYGYVGSLEIPALALTLPVLSEWDYERLAIAPCRQFGSCRTEDLVIAAHNFQSHFGRLQELTAGDSVVFTDMEGLVNTYSVEDIRILPPLEVSSVRDSGYALVLYTCTYGGANRVTVFCTRAA